MKRFLSVFCMVCLLTTAVSAASVDTVGTALYASVPTPQVGAVGGEWAVLGLARSSVTVPAAYYGGYYQRLCDYLAERDGVLHKRKYTEYARVILALTAIGKDPRNVGGYNLLTPLGDMEATVRQGLNGAVWALLALDCGGYEVPTVTEGSQASRAGYLAYLLEHTCPDGGWAMSGDTADPDLTAMVLQALAPYRSEEPVRAAVDAALKRLSDLQLEDGGYATAGSETAESCAQVLVALCTLGIAEDDPRFVKNGATVTDALFSFAEGDGFCHIHGGGYNQMATEQAFYALVARERAAEGKTALYDMSDRPVSRTNAKERVATVIRAAVPYPISTTW